MRASFSATGYERKKLAKSFHTNFMHSNTRGLLCLR